MLDTVRRLDRHLQSWGFHVGCARNFVGAVYVDNLFFASHSTGGAIRAAELVAQSLQSEWGLRVKPGSQLAMPAAGSPDWEELHLLSARWPSWRLVESFPCLGHSLAWDTSAFPCFAATKAAMLSAIAGNFNRNSKRALDPRRKLALIDRVARSVLDYRSSRWPISPTLTRALDSLQRRCFATALDLPRRPDEDLTTWQRRRSRHAGQLCRELGPWGQRHADRCRNWHAHLTRERNSASLPAIIFAHQGAAWRRERRLAAGSSRSEAGRLASRVLSHVHPRWEDSVAGLPNAASCAASSGTRPP